MRGAPLEEAPGPAWQWRVRLRDAPPKAAGPRKGARGSGSGRVQPAAPAAALQLLPDAPASPPDWMSLRQSRDPKGGQSGGEPTAFPVDPGTRRMTVKVGATVFKLSCP